MTGSGSAPIVLTDSLISRRRCTSPGIHTADSLRQSSRKTTLDNRWSGTPLARKPDRVRDVTRLPEHHARSRRKATRPEQVRAAVGFRVESGADRRVAGADQTIRRSFRLPSAPISLRSRSDSSTIVPWCSERRVARAEPNAVTRTSAAPRSGSRASALRQLDRPSQERVCLGDRQLVPFLRLLDQTGRTSELRRRGSPPRTRRP